MDDIQIVDFTQTAKTKKKSKKKGQKKSKTGKFTIIKFLQYSIVNLFNS